MLLDSAHAQRCATDSHMHVKATLWGTSTEDARAIACGTEQDRNVSPCRFKGGSTVRTACQLMRCLVRFSRHQQLARCRVTPLSRKAGSDAFVQH